jgi:dolichol-phosphate mannosyltransferase
MKIAIIPCYKSTSTALEIATKCLEHVDLALCVDDACPEGTGLYIERYKQSSSILVLYSRVNLGVGGAVKLGLKKAIELGGRLFIKIDSDGQMDPMLIPLLTERVEVYGADISKGNRFTDRTIVHKMPMVRLIGNMGLAFITKFSTGYWELFDPTNGFICLTKETVDTISLDKTDNRYFFETDLLFRAGLHDMVIDEIAMNAVYADEVSSLRPFKELSNFSFRHMRIALKRILYQYYLYDFNPGSIALTVSIFYLGIAIALATLRFTLGVTYGEFTPIGTLTLFLAVFLAGNQFLIGFLQYDSSQRVLMRQLKRRERSACVK